jgi:Undecaprenyl-phosphate galactose phosphotransferase WbaP
MLLADLLGVMLSFGIGFFAVNLYDLSAINFKSFVLYWPYLPVFILFFQFFNLYPGISLAPSEELYKFNLSSLMTHGGIIFSRYIEDQEFDAISVAFIVSYVVSTFILLTCRSGAHEILSKTRLGGIPAVVFGGGDMGRLTVDRLLDGKRTGYIPVLILEDNPEGGETYRDIPIIHDTSMGPEIVKLLNIKMAIVTPSGLNKPDWDRMFNYSVSAFRYHVLIPGFPGISNIWTSVRDFDGLLGFVTSHKLKMPWNVGIKRVMDVILAMGIGLVTLPVLLAIAVLVKATSRGPAIYGHLRLGRNGVPFKAYKFRSMVQDADDRLQALLDADPQAREEWESCRKLKNDPRVTKLGKFLRRTSLDEFPQLINVLKGDMSLVGPRPIVTAEIPKYGEDFRRIFSVRPGLSGMWQVSGRSDTDYRERVALDTYYLQSWSVWLDLWILYKTIGIVIKGKGAY